MYSNEVWIHIDPLKGIKLIDCKWIYKRKKWIDGKVKTFKIRLVAKICTQKKEIKYKETFSPVNMIKFICIL